MRAIKVYCPPGVEPPLYQQMQPLVLPVLLQIHLWFLSLALLQTLCQIRDGVFDLCS